MRHYFEPRCIECRSVSTAVDDAARKSRHFIGDRFTIRHVMPLSSSADAAGTLIRVDVSSVEVVDDRNHFVDGLGALRGFVERIYVEWRDDDWRVVEMIPRTQQ
jgi:hypothetical protein